MRSWRDRQAALGRAILSAALAGLIAAMVASPILEEALPGLASSYRRGAYAIIAAATIIGLWPFARWQRLVTVPWPLIATLSWCWFSLSWSVAPSEALVRLVLTTLVIWISFTTIRHLGYAQALGVIRSTLAVVLLINFAAVLLYPEIGMSRGVYYWSDHQWRGVMAHKNNAGALCAFTVLMFIFDVRRSRRLPYAIVAVFAAVFLIFTVSRTSMAFVTMGMLTGGAIGFFHQSIAARIQRRDRHRWRVFGYGIAALLIATMVFFTFRSDALLSLMTDPEALSRRTVVWRQLLQIYVQQPWSGVGFGSYWTGSVSSGERGATLRELTQGHNGILDILVQIGLPGLILVVFACVIWPFGILSREIAFAPKSSALLAALLVLCLGSNLTESGILERDTPWNVLLMLTLALTAALVQRRYPDSALWSVANKSRSAGKRVNSPTVSASKSGRSRRHVHGDGK